MSLNCHISLCLFGGFLFFGVRKKFLKNLRPISVVNAVAHYPDFPHQILNIHSPATKNTVSGSTNLHLFQKLHLAERQFDDSSPICLLVGEFKLNENKYAFIQILAFSRVSHRVSYKWVQIYGKYCYKMHLLFS